MLNYKQICLMQVKKKKNNIFVDILPQDHEKFSLTWEFIKHKNKAVVIPKILNGTLIISTSKFQIEETNEPEFTALKKI
ncbi:hypothetical protein BpHYR1_045298 [Brachionus plicatilis]|uniref:Uncharacterized protein n=1 Tax=Brachionus plicatilis TaxID=10195 RepID=A0A3M7SNC9_BRAPC|nr:hypothetical protein BpHYR1_045298 [Brachionus plicatilis]